MGSLFLILILLVGVTGSSVLRGQQEQQELTLTLQNTQRQLKEAPKTTQLDKRVALLQVHFEGNVGDQMETIPLLKRLHGKLLRFTLNIPKFMHACMHACILHTSVHSSVRS